MAEAAAVGRPHDVKGEAVAVFVTLSSGFEASEDLRKELKTHVRKEIGALAVPDDIRFTTVIAQDPQRQDHAPSVARHRRRQNHRGRHHHAGRLQRTGTPAHRRRINKTRDYPRSQAPPPGKGISCAETTVSDKPLVPLVQNEYYAIINVIWKPSQGCNVEPSGEIQYVTDAEGRPISVIVPIDLWREIESEKETAYLLKSEAMKEWILAAKQRQEGVSLDEARKQAGI